MMKKFLSLTMTFFILLGMCGITALAAETPQAEVYVTIADGSGQLVLAQEAISVTDTDNDGVLTINDALYAAHEAKYEGGAAAGYASSVGQYGLAMDKLWGTENGGSYGYYVNNASAWSLADPIKDGDYINAFVYTDLQTWSDTYCFFDVRRVSVGQNTDVTLTLSQAGYDADYNPITYPVANAVITVNGNPTAYRTDANGQATIQLSDIGTAIISASSETQTLVPPVCIASVGTNASALVYVTIADENGALALVQKAVTVSDIDCDGVLTIHDALYSAHEENYTGGAAAGYGSAYGAYGLSMTKLWGTENGGSYGYYVNNASAWSLTDPVRDGDYINAFVYTDLQAWSDTYCFFDAFTADALTGEGLTLKLFAAGYYSDYNPVSIPCANANITINGSETAYTTDADGSVTISFDEAGIQTISAFSANQTLVPPVCVVTVENASDTERLPEAEESSVSDGNETAPQTNDPAGLILFTCLSSAALVVFSKSRKNK
ncbi:MAG: hypothetical protein ACI3XM_02760 [Eubacteriales bacterium]